MRKVLGLVLVVLVAAVAYRAWPRRGSDAPATPLVAPAVTAAAPTPIQAESPAPTSRRRVQGRVFGPDGKGVDGADIALFRLQGHELVLPKPEPSDVFRSQADGSFTFEVTPVRDLAVGARTPNLVSSLVAVGDGRREIVLRMANAYEVRGHVNDHFAPVPGCEVVLESDDERYFSHVTKTGPDGAFTFTGIYPGLVTLSARASEYRPAVLRGVVVGSGKQLRLHVRDLGLTLVGRVLADDADDVGIAGAKVSATWQRDERVRPHAVPHVTTTRADGKFELGGLGPGVHRVEIAHPQRSTVVVMVDVEPRATAPLVARLPGRVSVRGRLVGAELLPTELLLVTEGRERARTRSDTGGRFEFPGQISRGAASLVLLERALSFARTSHRRIGVTLADEALSLPVVPALLLAGDVADADGKGVAGAEIYVDTEHVLGIDLLREPAAITDEDGRYRVYVGRSVPPQLTFRHPRLAPATVMLSAQASGVQQTVTLHAPSKIAGRVLRDDKPLPAAIVHLPVEAGVRGWATTGPDGAFTLHGVPPGQHQLIVRYGTMAEFSARATVLPGLDVEHAELTLPPGRQLEGRVVDAAGKPVAAAFVAAEAGGAVATDAAGRFVLDAPRGEIEVRAYAPAWRLDAASTVAPHERTVRIVLPVPPHGRVRARLQGVPGRRPEGALLGLVSLEDAPVAPGVSTLQWVEARDGVLRFDRFPAGRWRVTVRCDGYVPCVLEGGLREGGEWDFGVCALEAGAKLVGLVCDETGKPVPGALVLLGNEADLAVITEAGRARVDVGFGVRADVRGRFELTGVSSRHKTVVVHAPGFATHEEVLKVPADLLRQDPLPLTLRAGVDLVAQVLDSRDQPVANRAVELRKHGVVVEVARTDADGRCVFAHCSRGEYKVGLLGAREGVVVDVQRQQTYHATLRVADR